MGGQRRDPKPVVFSHVPKAGGSTVFSILTRNYGEGFEPAYGPRRDELAEQLSTARPGGRVTCIAGHQPFDTYSSEFHHIVLFRDPVARIRSLYGFLRRRKGTHGPTWKAAISNDLTDFVAAVPLETLNAQVRFAAGRREPVPSDQLDALDAAIARLSAPNVTVGVLDLMPESIYLFGTDLGWRRRYYLPRNVAPPGAAATPQPTAAEPELEAATVLDDRLVNWARERVVSRIAGLSDSERRDLERFRSRLRMLSRAVGRMPKGRVTRAIEHRLP